MCTTQLANPIVVPQGHEIDINFTPSRSKTMKRPTGPSQQPQLMPSPMRLTTLVGVPLIQKQLNNTGVSAAALEVTMASWRQGSLKECDTFL